jgi:hypothetical protein
MARVLSQPDDPEAIGLAVLALRNYVSPVAKPTTFEKQSAAAFKTLGIKKTTAKRFLANFDKIRASDRERYLGKIGVAKAMPRAAVKKRDLNSVTTNNVVVPQVTLQHRFRGFPFGAPQLPGGPLVLAPIDYTINYTGMHCIDETHYDWAGSDEIYIITSAAHIAKNGDNVVRTERHPINNGKSGIYGDVDSHDTRVGPRAACWNGQVANVQLGMSLTTVVFEHDYGDPDHFKEDIDDAVKLALGIVALLYPPSRALIALIVASGYVTDFVNWLIDTGDDEIGTVTHVLDFSDLEDYARSNLINYSEYPGATGSSGKPTGLMYHFRASVNDNDYVAAYQVTRNPFAPVYQPGPVD